MRTGRSENIFFHCIFAYSHLRFLMESQLSSPTCYLGKFFQLMIVRSDTLQRYIALNTIRFFWKFSWFMSRCLPCLASLKRAILACRMNQSSLKKKFQLTRHVKKWDWKNFSLKNLNNLYDSYTNRTFQKYPILIKRKYFPKYFLQQNSIK